MAGQSDRLPSMMGGLLRRGAVTLAVMRAGTAVGMAVVSVEVYGGRDDGRELYQSGKGVEGTQR